MDEPYMTYALWGTGDLTPASATALLEEYIPENVGTVYRPEVVTRDQKGLRTALDWFESDDFLGAGGAVPSTDLIQSLTFDRDTQGDEVYLLALWPETPGHDDFDFIEAVQNAGITVFDLSRALDELDLSLYSRPEPTKEEKAEAREEAKRGRGTRRKLSDAGEAPEATEPEQVAEAPGEAPEAADYSGVPGVIIEAESVVSAKWLADQMMTSIKLYIDDQIQRAVAAALAGRETVVVQESLDRPPFDPPYVGVDTRPYYMQKSTGRFRPADGKPRRGEEVHNFTDEEAREKGIIE